ncbi:ABC transporter substrate-binding protein [Brachybacterium ginsengisoli]|uniref:ABC transporter substrate-binding protein n=1 Tax=Brachybacterium ginsengisoli TaxID=1331682 RepID=A0A291GTU9_9MICO|nr:extracellular solute-binding protein [Brachybacterium ginsengisoli]ATG53641.1 ABC transporter substrate-binding protein [Brachybacterium ginsengisoli]
MIQRRSLLKALPVAAAGGLALSACGGNSGSGGSGGSDGSLTWMSMLHTPTTPDAAGPVMTGLQEHAGVEFEFQWVPDASKEEKITAALASGSLADINTLNQGMAAVREPLASGLFWDVEPLLADFPNLSAINPAIIDAARLDGALYGIPFQKPMARYGVLVRQDWLDRLGLEVPHTTAELEEVAKAFAEGDPTGTGAATTGFIDREESFVVGFRSLSGYFGAGDRFELDSSGKIVPAATTEAFKEAMEWYRGIYEAGGINKEFITTQKQNQQQAIAQDKGGLVVTGLFEAKNYVALANEINAETEVQWTLINDITHEDVPRRILSDTSGGMGGLMALNTQTLKSEEDAKRALGLIDKLLDEKAFELMTNGVEGTHFEIDADGAVTITDQTRWEQEVQPYSSSRPSDQVVLYKSTDDYVNLANELMAENDEFAIVNPAQSLSSPTYDSQWTTIETALNDAYNTFIMGQSSMADYEATIESLRGQGLDDITAEYTEAHDAVS